MVRASRNGPVSWLAGHVNIVLVAVLLIVGGTWGFIELADGVRDGDTQRFDDWAVRAMRRADDPSQPRISIFWPSMWTALLACWMVRDCLLIANAKWTRASWGSPSLGPSLAPAATSMNSLYSERMISGRSRPN